MFTREDRHKLIFPIFMAFSGLVSGCKGKSSSPVAPIEVNQTAFFTTVISGAFETASSPTPQDTLTGAGIAEFSSQGLFTHGLSFSDSSTGSASGSYFIQSDGRMTASLDGGLSLPGAVNPEEDFLFLADNTSADDGKLGVLFAATPASFPADALPDFSGSYNLVGVQFLYPGGAGFDLRANARTHLASMLIVQNDNFGGSFFINGNDSAGNVISRTGSFVINVDLKLVFSIDGAPGELWMGSFAPSGLIVLADTTLGNGDAGNYVAIPNANFSGQAPLAFDGSYRVVKLRFFADSGTAFGTELEGSIRNFFTNGIFADACEAPFNCSGFTLNAPYALSSNGFVSMNDPFLGSTLEGAITEDLGVFAVVQINGSPLNPPQEVSFQIGVRLIP